MAYLRFALCLRDPDSAVAGGPFRVAYRLYHEGCLDGETHATLRSLLVWFDAYLPVPSRFGRSRAKGARHRPHRGVSWFKDSAQPAVSQMRRLMALLETQGYPGQEMVATRVGYVVYEDNQQVVAEPFRDTPSGHVRP